jgi:hypothetical protein
MECGSQGAGPQPVIVRPSNSTAHVFAFAPRFKGNELLCPPTPTPTPPLISHVTPLICSKVAAGAGFRLQGHVHSEDNGAHLSSLLSITTSFAVRILSPCHAAPPRKSHP